MPIRIPKIHTERSENAGVQRPPTTSADFNQRKAIGVREIMADFPVMKRDAVGAFSQLPVPVIPVGSMGLGDCAWYGLMRLRVGGQQGFPELAFAGCDVDMLSCDVSGLGIPGVVNAAGVGAGLAVAWGDTMGDTAAMVCGLNLPFRNVNAWEAAPAAIEGLQASATSVQTASNKFSAAVGPEYLLVEHFPLGKYDRATPTNTGWVRGFRNYAAGIKPINAGSTFDIALVMAGPYVRNLDAAKVLCGRGSMRPVLYQLNNIASMWQET